MKILIRNSDNAVLFADDSLQLTDTGASGNGWIASFVNSTNSRLEDATLPADWVGAAYSYYGGVWTVIDQAAIDAAKPVVTREMLKAQRDAAVANIKVTTAAGNTFDGDEVSINRMNAAITVLMATGGTVPWVLANNTIVTVTAAELTEALALSAAEVARLWVVPYAD